MRTFADVTSLVYLRTNHAFGMADLGTNKNPGCEGPNFILPAWQFEIRPSPGERLISPGFGLRRLCLHAGEGGGARILVKGDLPLAKVALPIATRCNGEGALSQV